MVIFDRVILDYASSIW